MRALITGATGQDGRYLANLLLQDGYEVYGFVRGQHEDALLDPSVVILRGDLLDQASLYRAVEESSPDEIYNLGALTHVGISFGQADLTANVTGLGCLRVLEAMRRFAPEARFYQASSSELYGVVTSSPQNELTPFRPASPYACAKLFAHDATRIYRESYGLHASCGILFNHESPLRGPEFVTRKITMGVARIYTGENYTLRLGNIDAVRDWGHAADYVRAMQSIVNQPEPDDYVIATGESHSVRDFLDAAFSLIGVTDWTPYVVLDEKELRPLDVPTLCGDASKAKGAFGWQPSITFKKLVQEMFEKDVECLLTKQGKTQY